MSNQSMRLYHKEIKNKKVSFLQSINKEIKKLLYAINKEIQKLLDVN